jgi:hypothetical protein
MADSYDQDSFQESAAKQTVQSSATGKPPKSTGRHQTKKLNKENAETGPFTMAAIGSLHESTASIVNRRNIIDCNKLAAPGLQGGGNTRTSSDSLQNLHQSKESTSRNGKQFKGDGVAAAA